MTTPATDWKEDIPADEAARFERYAEQMLALQRKNAHGGPVSRGLHAKGNLGLEAQFDVLPDLPEHARVALFGKPGTYRAYVRFSNGSGLHQHDKKGDVRGIAIKVLGVTGKKIIPGLEDAPTQDFLLIRTDATGFRSPDEFVGLVTAMGSPLTGLFGFMGRFGIGRTIELIKKLTAGLKGAIPSLAGIRYYSALPLRFGPYAARLTLKPNTAVDPNAPVGSGADYLGDELAGRLRAGPVSWDFGVQFFVDEARTPIEDPSVGWPEELAPYVTVGRLTLPKQDPSSARGQALARFVEALSFDPWHALEELRPLGAMMRARNAAYRLSTKERKAAGEPDGSETFPD